MDDYREMLEYLCGRRMKTLKDASIELIKEIEKKSTCTWPKEQGLYPLCNDENFNRALEKLKNLVK